MDTRKNTPNFRIFEKYAAKIGTNHLHRFNLSDCVMLKDNHIALYDNSISKAVNSKIIKAMPFVMPSEPIILAFSKLVDPILNEIKNKQAICITLTEARDRLLPQLMSGELEV